MSHKTLYRRWPGILPLVLLSAILCGKDANPVNSGPVPPCGSTTAPPYPDVDRPPTVKAWDRSELAGDWTPPACTGWTTRGLTTLAVTVARFRHSSGAAGLLSRIGDISKLSGVRYWSTTHKRWQTLIVDAYALSGPDRSQRRKDFSQDEIKEGGFLYYQQEDNLSGKAIYRVHIQAISNDRLVFNTENVSTMRYLM